MPGKRAKILSAADVGDLLVFASCTRHPLRNTVMVLLSAKAGLRAGEIANLTWDMVVDANGQVSGLIELADSAAKKCSGRSIPIHPDLAAALAAWRQVSPAIRLCDRVRARRPNEAAQHRRVVQPGVQEHWPERLLVALRPPNVRHPGRSDRPQGRRLAAGRAAAGRPPVDPDDAAVHRRRQRRAAQTGCDDLRAMVATTTIRHRQTKRQNHPQNSQTNLGSNRPRCSASFMRFAASPGQQHGLTTFEPTCGLTRSKRRSGIATPLLCSTG